MWKGKKRALRIKWMWKLQQCVGCSRDKASSTGRVFDLLSSRSIQNELQHLFGRRVEWRKMNLITMLHPQFNQYQNRWIVRFLFERARESRWTRGIARSSDVKREALSETLRQF